MDFQTPQCEPIYFTEDSVSQLIQKRRMSVCVCGGVLQSALVGELSMWIQTAHAYPNVNMEHFMIPQIMQHEPSCEKCTPGPHPCGCTQSCMTVGAFHPPCLLALPVKISPNSFSTSVCGANPACPVKLLCSFYRRNKSPVLQTACVT